MSDESLNTPVAHSDPVAPDILTQAPLTQAPLTQVPLTQAIFSRASFISGAMSPKGFPDTEFPEMAFIGRSNVGKSSLINGLLGRKNLAQTSKKPGKTAQINFFNVADTFVLVDMPGYGYAAVSHKTKEVWNQMIPEYFQQRPQWIHTFLLVDSRHPPQKADQMILNFLLRFTTPFTLILTKVDKISQALRHERTATLSKALKRTPLQSILPFSVDDPVLKQNLREYVLSILNG